MEPLDNTSRRGFLKTSSMLGLGAALGRGIASQALPDPPTTTNNQSTMGDAIRPFHVNFPESELAELRRRIRSTRWSERELVGDPSQGVQLNTMQKVAEYWGASTTGVRSKRD